MPSVGDKTTQESFENDPALNIAGQRYSSRLLVGTGKYRDRDQAREAIAASGAEIVTVAIRRMTTDKSSPVSGVLDYLDSDRYTILPNTAGCFDADSALRTCRLARELLDGKQLVKLEVIGDPHTLYPDATETLRATKILVQEGFHVMAYTNDDPILARQLQEEGCVAIMPLAAPIGSGMGILNRHNIQVIVNTITVPVLVDAGVGTASDAAIAMELGCDGVLMNTAIACADNPVLMAQAMRQAVQAGRLARLAGRIPAQAQAQASSPTIGKIDDGPD